MFSSLSEKLGNLVNKLQKQAKITEDNIKDIVREIRLTLLEADVALPVVKEFTEKVREQAIGSVVQDRLNPGNTFVKIVAEQLKQTLGGDIEPMNLARQKPIVILLAGLQGAGKTTSAAKLGLWFQKQRLQTMLCSTDVYRPAAIDQLRTLCEESELGFFAPDTDKPVAIAAAALQNARNKQMDVLIVDTAGRMGIDKVMMDEIAAIHAEVNPAETMLVIDAMTGQDAANTASAFHNTLPLTGLILSKADSDARGGAALSVAMIAGIPVRFLGIGEKTAALETFDADRMAKRILGMGDVMGIIEQAQSHTDKEAMTALEQKLRRGKGFSLLDYKTQIEQLGKMGGIGNLVSKIPGMGNKINAETMDEIAGKQTGKHIALINSMTPKERNYPDIINPSRKRRIAAGAGMEIVELNRLLKQFKQMAKMMSKMGKKGGKRRMMQQFQQMGGGNNLPF